MSKHTPGPWRYERGSGHALSCIRGAEVFHTNGRHRTSPSGPSSASYSDEVCVFRHDDTLPGPAANIRLLEKAPDLLGEVRGRIDECPTCERNRIVDALYPDCPACGRGKRLIAYIDGEGAAP